VVHEFPDPAVRAAFSGLRPRDIEFRHLASVRAVLDHLTVADPRRLAQVLGDIAPAQLLCAARLAHPDHLPVLHAAFDYASDAPALFSYLAGDFPPSGDIPVPRDARIRAGLIGLADGLPGDAVSHGVFPSPITKLARLSLASTGYFPRSEVLDAARSAYDTRHPYCAHDAVACALVHPDVSVGERIDLVAQLAALGPDGRAARGWRTRKKFWRIVRWAGLPPDKSRAG
jgi:hypothetical protein